MRNYLIRRIIQNGVTYILFLVVAYFLIDAQPGDFCNGFTSDPRLTAVQRADIRERLGCNKPVLEAFALWMGNFMTGNLGISFSNYPRPVFDIILERAPRTLMLFITSTVVSFYVGFLSGKMLAMSRGSFFEYTATIGGVALYTVFTPWFALMLIWFFAFQLRWFPIAKFVDPILWLEAPVNANFVFIRMLATAVLSSITLLIWFLSISRMDPLRRNRIQWIGPLTIVLVALGYWVSTGVGKYALDILHHIILPVMVLTLVNFAGTMLLTRNSMLETLREDYVLTARAKGLSDNVVRDRHVARNALLPVVTSLIFSLAFVMDGGVITETIFAWPGMGLTLLNAALREDIPMVLGGLVFTGALALTGHLGADILYAYLDPRIRY